jgi:hypothetical protein
MKRFWAPKNGSLEALPGTSSDYKVWMVLGICAIVVVIGYIWLISAMQWFVWSEHSDYYYQLADAFDHGQLSLQVQTDPGLLALSNPYEDSNQRDQLSFPWDTSFYRGKFYLYWGPAPALLLALVQVLYRGDIGDEYVLFTFLVGLFLFNLLILRALWSDLSKTLPIWTLVLGVLLIGFVNPIPWLLGQHRIYEAAISAGQFFVVGGLYWVYRVLRRTVLSKWTLGLAGLFWTLAIGSRITLALPIAVAICLTVLYIARSPIRPSGLSQLVKACAAFGFPVAMGGIGYSWYNWSRFGSIFEFGLRYQLNHENLRRNFPGVFSRLYFSSNLYNYMLASSHKIIAVFPFWVPRAGKSLLGNGITHQGIYAVHRITGILLSFPFVVFAVIPLVVAALIVSRNRLSRSSVNPGPLSLHFSLILAVCSLLGFIPALFFFWVDMRYLFDFIPELALLAVLGFWQSFYYLSQAPVARKVLSALAIGLALFSVVFSMILGSASY